MKTVHYLKALTLLFTTVLFACQSTASNIPKVVSLDFPPAQVLFTGNSYTYYNDSIHNHVKRMAIAGGEQKKLKYRAITISGAWLGYHPVEHYVTPGAVGFKKPFDVVVLQDNSGSALNEKNAERFKVAVRKHSKTIKASGAQPALYMTHAYEEGHKRYDPNYIRKLEELFISTGNEVGAMVLPVGLAFERAHKARPDLSLHQYYDHSHPNLLGTYLAACVVYASLYNQSCAGNEYDYFGKVDKSVIPFLQGIADETVKTFFGR